MKKDFGLRLTTAVCASFLALSVAGCGNTDQADWDDGVAQYADNDTAVCVLNGQRVDDDYCDRDYRSTGGSTNAYMWYYLGRNSALPYYGQSVYGGTYNRSPGTRYYYAPKATAVTKSQAISRGGFGSSARSNSSYGGGSRSGSFGG